MIGIKADDSEQMDYKTSRSICDAVGERLQKDLRPERSDLSPRLRELLNELRRQDEHSATAAARKFCRTMPLRLRAAAVTRRACFPSRIFRYASQAGF